MTTAAAAARGLLFLLFLHVASSFQHSSPAAPGSRRSVVRVLRALQLRPVGGAAPVDLSLKPGAGAAAEEAVEVGEGVSLSAKGGRFYCQSEQDGALITTGDKGDERSLTSGIKYLVSSNAGWTLKLPNSGATYELCDDGSDASAAPPGKDPMMSMMFEAMKKSYGADK